MVLLKLVGGPFSPTRNDARFDTDSTGGRTADVPWAGPGSIRLFSRNGPGWVLSRNSVSGRRIPGNRVDFGVFGSGPGADWKSGRRSSRSLGSHAFGDFCWSQFLRKPQVPSYSVLCRGAGIQAFCSSTCCRLTSDVTGQFAIAGSAIPTTFPEIRIVITGFFPGRPGHPGPWSRRRSGKAQEPGPVDPGS